MRLHVRTDPSHARRWLIDLRDRLQRDGHVCDFVAGPATPEPSAVGLLFQLESLIYRRRGPLPSDPIDWDELKRCNSGGSQPPDLVIDLAAAPAACCQTSPRLVVLYDGQAGLPALLAPLLEGRMSTVSVADAATGAIVVDGVPGTDNAETVSQAMEFALARVVTLIAGAVARYPNGAVPAGEATKARPTPAVSSPAALSFLMRAIAFSAVRRLYKLCYYAPHWRIGWRFIERRRTGSLRDPQPRRCAVEHPARSGRAVLRRSVSDQRQRPALHLLRGPRSSGAEGRHLLRRGRPRRRRQPGAARARGALAPFLPLPLRGRRADLDDPRELGQSDHRPLPGRPVPAALDESGDAAFRTSRPPTPPWYVTTGACGCSRPRATDRAPISDTLSLFSAPRLTGPWTPHPANPVLVDQRAARPAGGFFMRDDRLWRPVQDCERGYGTGIGLAEVARLDETAFEQRVHTVLRTPLGWTGRRLHTLTRYGQLECIDGSAHSPKIPALFGTLDRPLRKRSRVAPFVDR